MPLTLDLSALRVTKSAKDSRNARRVIIAGDLDNETFSCALFSSWPSKTL